MKRKNGWQERRRRCNSSEDIDKKCRKNERDSLHSPHDCDRHMSDTFITNASTSFEEGHNSHKTNTRKRKEEVEVDLSIQKMLQDSSLQSKLQFCGYATQI